MRSALVDEVRRSGVVSRERALAVFAEHVVDDAVTDGVLVRAAPQVYALAPGRDRTVRRLAALTWRPDGALSHTDALDVWAVHGVGGTWGAIATGLFATVAINAGGLNGLFYGNPRQLLVQLLAVAVSWAYAAAGTFIILKAVDRFVPLRVEEAEEALGLDLSQHGEPAYAL